MLVRSRRRSLLIDSGLCRARFVEKRSKAHIVGELHFTEIQIESAALHSLCIVRPGELGYRHLDAYRGKLRGDHIGGGEAEGVLFIDHQREFQCLPIPGARAGSIAFVETGLLQQFHSSFLILLDARGRQPLQRMPIRAERGGAG